MRVALSRRLARAFAVGLPTIEERQLVLAAAEAPRVRTFEDLPLEVRRLVLRLED